MIELWSKAYYVTMLSYGASDVATDLQGNVVVTGRSYNGSNLDYLTIKYDSATGDELWSKAYDAEITTMLKA